MRSMRRKTRRSRTARRGRLTVESLDARLLLCGIGDWVDGEDLSEFIRPGYGIPDPFYSDPSTWSPADLSQLEHVLVDDSAAPSTESWTADDGADAPEGIWGEPAGAVGGYVLYLDFDGARVHSRPGDFYLGSSYVDIPAYDLSVYGWGGREQQSIAAITEFVREDYAAYHVSVTNVQPTSGQYTTIYVGGDDSWFRPGSNIIGVATYDIGNVDASNFGFAFSEELAVYANYSGGSLLNFSEYLANLISHEAAHTFGANHISDTSAIMNPYLATNHRTNMFGSGSITNRSSTQDTQSLLGDNMGWDHGLDDYGDNYLDATSIDANRTLSALLERRDDVDAFSFTAIASGTAVANIATDAYGNLDSYLSVYGNGDSVALAENNNYQGLADSRIAFDVVAGEEYSLYVSSYGGNSSGSYALTLESATTAPQITVSDNWGLEDDWVIGFGSVVTDSISSGTITIANTGSEELVVTELSVTGGFAIDRVSMGNVSGDDIVIGAGAEMQVTVVFEPHQVGDYEGVITIVSNDSQNSIVNVSLTGSAFEPEPDLTVATVETPITASVVNLPRVLRGEQALETFIIRNDGLAALTVSAINATGSFEIIDWAGGAVVINPDDSLEVTVCASSFARGSLAGSLIILSDDPDRPVTSMGLTTQVVGGVLAVHESAQTIDDNIIDFGDVYLGENPTQTITLTNVGDAELTVTGLNAAGAFTVENPLDAGDPQDDIVLAVGESMVFTVSCAPTEVGGSETGLSITTDDCEFPFSTVLLSAEGKVHPLEVTEIDGLEDGSLDAGPVRIGSAGEIAVWQVTNYGNIPVTVSLALAAGSDFEIVGDETVVVAAGQNYVVNVELTGTQATQLNDILTLLGDDIDATSKAVTISADAYAVVGGGQRYRFIDHNGDVVTISLSGQAEAAVRLGAPGQADIASIEILSGSGKETLAVRVSGAGETQLGELTGSADLKSIWTPHVDLIGAGIDLDASVEQLRLGDVTGEAGIRFAAQGLGQIRLGAILTDSQIDIDGALQVFYADEFIDGYLQTGAISRMVIGGPLGGDVHVTDAGLNRLVIRQGNFSGSVNVNGAIGNVILRKGDLTGSLSAGGDINRVALPSGTIAGEISSDTITAINAQNINHAHIAALNYVGRINVRRDMYNSTVTVGLDHLGQAAPSSSVDEASSAYLRVLNVRGTYAGSTIAVGVVPDSNGSFMTGAACEIGGAIGRVNLPHVDTDNQATPFGLIAQQAIAKMRINKQVINCDYQQDDFYVRFRIFS